MTSVAQADPATAHSNPDPATSVGGRRFGIEEVVETLDPAVLSSLDDAQSLLLERAIRTALPRNTPKLIDWQTSIPAPRGRMFLVIQLGREQGRAPLAQLATAFRGALNGLIGCVVVGGLLYALAFGLYYLVRALGLGLGN